MQRTPSVVERRCLGFVCLTLVALLARPGLIEAQQSTVASEYRTPTQVLVDIVDAPPAPSVRLSPRDEWLVLLGTSSYRPIEELAERELRLAGIRIKPSINGPSRMSPYTGLEFVRLSDSRQVQVSGLPPEPRIENVVWSPDGKRILFTHTTPRGIELWVAEAATGQASRLTGATLNLTLADDPRWFSDSKTILATFVPESRSPQEPEPPTVPAGPTVQQNVEKTAPVRTYQDLLTNAYDADLFEHYATAQLGTVTIDKKITVIGKPAIIYSQKPSPDGRYLLVETLHRPFSYLVTVSRFPRRIDVVDLTGTIVYHVGDLPLQEEIPVASGSVPTGRRSVGWRNDAAATLVWAEALDGGDAGKPADERDRVYMLAAPFESEPTALVTLALRYSHVLWASDDLALVSESWRRTRRTRTWMIRPGRPQAEPAPLLDRSTEDRYGDPGSFMTRRNGWGESVLLTADRGRTLFLSGSGASAEGERPFVDKLDIRTKHTERLFQSVPPYYERAIDLLNRNGRYLLTVRESQNDPPNYFMRDLRNGRLRQLTSFDNPTPQLNGMQKELIRYKRADGVDLQATLYLPAGYDAQRDGPLPLFVWAYPREFKDARLAGQVSGSPYQFTQLTGWSRPIWTALGYAVLDDASMPIVGEGDEEPNDTYVEQLVGSAQAAIDEVVRRGVADRTRVGVGGHSYGAFMTANLLSHSDLFAAGIARSGAYNRSLTPFGFQNEERTFWEAPEVYFAMSPFMHADKVNEPILLIHGELDNNSGTFPVQSRRYYHALKGLGATARLVMLPYESHGYRARESILHMLWEMQQWLDRYVKKAAPSEPRVSRDEGY